MGLEVGQSIDIVKQYLDTHWEVNTIILIVLDVDIVTAIACSVVWSVHSL